MCAELDQEGAISNAKTPLPVVQDVSSPVKESMVFAWDFGVGQVVAMV